LALSSHARRRSGSGARVPYETLIFADEGLGAAFAG
jgi:hypothetical protein